MLFRSQQNGVAERKHRHIVECALTLLSHSQLSPIFWSYAVSTSVHLINRLPTPTLHNSTPWEVLFKSKPDLTHLRTFGCICFPLLKSYNAHKLLPYTSPCIFLGYPTHSKGYICQDPVTSRVYISRHVHFNEHEFIPSLALSTGTSLLLYPLVHLMTLVYIPHQHPFLYPLYLHSPLLSPMTPNTPFHPLYLLLHHLLYSLMLHHHLHSLLIHNLLLHRLLIHHLYTCLLIFHNLTSPNFYL